MYVAGQVLSRKNIEDIIKFAHRENLFIFADEVSPAECPRCRVYVHHMSLRVARCTRTMCTLRAASSSRSSAC